MNKKPLLCLDFDGVIHSYSTGWLGVDKIPDPPVSGALEFIEEAAPLFDIAIYSSRSEYPEGIAAMQSWLSVYLALRMAEREGPDATNLAMRVHAFVYIFLQWPTEKPSAFITIDDRAITFEGTWPKVETLLQFKPWNKRDATS